MSGLISEMADAASFENQAIESVRRRLMPFLLLMYIIAFLDRANIGFAKQALQASTGISEAAYGLGAGLFFLTYALLEVPSNLIMHRIGARIWMFRIMVSWGLVSMATMFVSGRASFYVLRLCLGAAEAGFFPGVILYLTYWFPNRVRGRMLGQFYFGAPLAFIFGGPLSGALLGLHGKGLQGWQWMFLVEGLLAVVVGVWAYWYLGNKPADASWLPARQKQALLARLAIEEQERRSYGPSAFLATFGNLRVLHFALTYCLIQMSVYGVVFYLPAEVATMLHGAIGFEVGAISTIPWICALAAVFWLPLAAGRNNNHRLLGTLVLAFAACAGLIFPSSGPVLGFAALCVAASSFIAVQPLFWTFPTGYLAGGAAAAGIALINAVGNLGGFLAPGAKIWADRHYQSHTAGLYLLAGLAALNALLFSALRGPKQAQKIPRS